MGEPAKKRKKIPEDYPFSPPELISRDLRRAMRSEVMRMSRGDIRYIVDLYYQVQDFRKAAGNQESVQTKGGEPAGFVDWVSNQMRSLESQIKSAMEIWTNSSESSRWAKSMFGIGPILSAGLEAHIDIERSPTAGAIWSFAGLNSEVAWLGKTKSAELIKELGITKKNYRDTEVLSSLSKATHRKFEIIQRAAEEYKWGEFRAWVAKRPWNARLKVLCWKIGESFVKFHNVDKCYYGKLYEQRKEQEQRKNEAGEFKDQAAHILETKDIKVKAVIERNKAGFLTDGHIEARARRWAVKMFLSHWHHVAYRAHFKKDPPKPFPIAHLDHVHYIPPPE